MGKIFNFPTKEISMETATHWVCKEVPEGYENLLTRGKAYKMEYDNNTDEYFFYDDQCFNVTYYLAVPGRFVVID